MNTTTEHASLDEQLAATHRWLPRFDHGLANHVPMMLHALHRLGAPAQRRAALVAPYVARLEARGAMASLAPTAGWRQLAGHVDAFEPLLSGMQAMLDRRGLDATLREVLPVIVQGVGGDAFHGLIRTAHAVDGGLIEEIAHGLAYGVSTAMPLRADGAPWPEGALATPAWLDAVLALPRPSHPDLERPRIALRMQAWASARGFDDVATSLAVPQDAGELLRDLARRFASLYAVTGNFTVLHLVTSCWSLQSLLGWIDEPRAAVRSYAVAVAAGLHAGRLDAWPATADQPPADAGADWTQLAAAACAIDDDHAAKLVFSAGRLAQAWPQEDAVFRAAAARCCR